jgi:hypothetical protein
MREFFPPVPVKARTQLDSRFRGNERWIDHAASDLLNPFHMAVAEPDSSTRT